MAKKAGSSLGILPTVWHLGDPTWVLGLVWGSLMGWGEARGSWRMRFPGKAGDGSVQEKRKAEGESHHSLQQGEGVGGLGPGSAQPCQGTE